MVTGSTSRSAAAALLSTCARAVAAAVALACVALALTALAPRPAQADASGGYFTLAGVVGVDEAAAFYSLGEAVAAVASCDPSSQLQDPTSAIVVVHGTVYLDAFQLGGAVNLFYPVDGSTYALVGADAGSHLVVEGGPLGLSNAGGSLVLRGLTVTGDLSLGSRDDLAVDACVFNGQLACQAGGNLGVSGNVFETVRPGEGCALSAALAGAESDLSFVGNTVTGYACAVAVACSQPQNTSLVSVTSNRFSLATTEFAEQPSTVLCLAGGPWAPASLVRDGNAVDAAEVLLTLDASFVAQVGEATQSLEGDTLTADVVAALLQMTGVGTSVLPEGIRGIAVVPAYQATYAGEQVALASEWVLPGSGAAVGQSTFTVTYDPNGASGIATDPVRVEAGTAVSAANMGSLILPNFTFQGWNTAPDGSGTFYAVGQVFSPQNDMVLYAQWAPSGTVATMDVAAGAGA